MCATNPDLGLEYSGALMGGENGTGVTDLQSELDGGQRGGEIAHQGRPDHHRDNTFGSEKCNVHHTYLDCVSDSKCTNRVCAFD